jgi:hypothetical protein
MDIMFAKIVLKEEITRLQHLLINLKKNLSKLPKGSISEKDRNGIKYYYWASRENKKIIFKYIGKADSESVIKAQEQREKQVELSKRIKRIQVEIRELEKLVYGSRRQSTI